MAHSQNSKLQRYKYYLTVLFQIYKPKCCFCKEELDPDGFFPKKSGSNLDPFMIHHSNHDRTDNSPKNLKFAHRSCHSKHHWKTTRKGG